MNDGKEPVYQKKLVVNKDEVRVTAHRITDALLGRADRTPRRFRQPLHFLGALGQESPHLQHGR